MNSSRTDSPLATWVNAADYYTRLVERYQDVEPILRLLQSLAGYPYQEALYVHASPYLALTIFILRSYPDRTQVPHVHVDYFPRRGTIRLMYEKADEPWPVYQERICTGQDVYERPPAEVRPMLDTLMDRLLADRARRSPGSQTADENGNRPSHGASARAAPRLDSGLEREDMPR